MAARNPEHVHPEHDAPTPENIDEWDEDELEAWKESQREKLDAEAQENVRDLSEEARSARDRLMGLGVDTATVDLAAIDPQIDESVEVTVKTELSGRVERNLTRVEEVDDFEEKLDLFLGIFEEIVVGPAGYNDREAWHDVWEARGTAFLLKCLDVLLEPMLEGESAMKSFREDE